MNRCRRCGRILTAPKSIANGLGEDCATQTGTTPRMRLVEGAEILAKGAEEWMRREGRDALQRLNDGRPLRASTRRLLWGAKRDA